MLSSSQITTSMKRSALGDNIAIVIGNYMAG
jgi:hypothetical protein